MTFIWDKFLWLLLLVPVLVWFYIMVQRRRQKYALRYASLSLVKEAMGSGPGKRRHIPPAVFLLGFAVLCVAIARPQATVTLPSQQGTVILTMDVSGSMRAEDMKPNRLEAAKIAALAFVDQQPPNVRIGVVSFSDNPAVVQAPTTDREAIKASINRLTTQRGTGIGKGILTSLDAIFEDADAPRLSPPPSFDRRNPLGQALTPTPTFTPVPRGTFAPAVIVLLSDGQNNVAPPPLDIISQAVDRGVRIYTVGVGSVTGAVLNASGFNMRVRLDEETLKRIAERTDANYFKADDETNLVSIYEDLSKKLVFKPEQTEITAFFACGAGFLFLVAGMLSLLWFHRLP